MGTEGSERAGQDEQGPPGSGQPPGAWHRVGRYVVSAIALIAIIAVVVLIHSRLQPRIQRAPVEFLPLSTRAAFAVDTRPDSPAVRTMREVWPEADVRHLSERGAALTQGVVDWTGLRLDVRSDIASWYGNELVVGAVEGADAPVVGPRSTVLVARATNIRRARAALDRAPGPPSRELEWRRSVSKKGRDRITVWREPSGKEEIAYAARDGCLLVARSRKVLEQCLDAADRPSQRLTGTEAFRQGVNQISAGALAWGYLDASHLRKDLRGILPGIWRGWGEALRGYLGGGTSTGARARPAEETTAALAVALAPERDGIRLRGKYWRASPAKAKDAPSRLDGLADALPRGTVGYVLVHEPARWLPFIGDLALSQPRGADQQGLAGAGLSALVLSWAAMGTLPHDVLAAIIAVGKEGKTAIVVAAPSDQVSLPKGGLAGFMLSGLVSASIGDVTVVATNEEALGKCKLALEDASRRLQTEVGDDVRFDVWARPGEMWDRLARLRELHLRGWESASGGEGELALKVRPRDLLGGG